jgi:hypothetical protein
VVTKDLLRITSWFPFYPITATYDLEHVIPRSSISSLQKSKLLWKETLPIKGLERLQGTVHAAVGRRWMELDGLP